jgi:hypothetical protein
MQANQNILIASANPFSLTDLTINVKGNIVDTLLLSTRERQYHYSLRQSWIVKNCKSIAKAKEENNPNSVKITADLQVINDSLQKELANLKHANEFLREPVFKEDKEFVEYFSAPKNVVRSNEEIIEEFKNLSLSLNTSEFIAIVNSISQNHLVKLRKLSEKELAKL